MSLRVWCSYLIEVDRTPPPAPASEPEPVLAQTATLDISHTLASDDREHFDTAACESCVRSVGHRPGLSIHAH